MKLNNYLYSVLGVIMAIGDAGAGLRVSNISRNYEARNKAILDQQYYNQTEYIESDVPVNMDLPVAVADTELAEQIKSGDENAETNMETLTRCAMIYPEGNFVWDKPTLGRGAGGPATCVSVVEVRALGANGNLEYTVAARGKLAAGDSIRCNISDFPASSYLPDIANIVFPADAKPTREDVIRVLNEEQKNNAGLKIAAAALIGGIGGNIVGKNAIGEDSLMGTNSEKMTSTAIGAAGGAALMAASTYSGKVAGDVILNTGVNAAAGGVIGNMVAVGDSVMRVEKCTYEGRETTCLWGTVQKTENFTGKTVYATADFKNIVVCDNDTTGCQVDNTLVIRRIAGVDVSKKQNEIEQGLSAADSKFYFDSRGKKMENTPVGDSPVYFTADVEKRDGAPVAAVIVDFADSAFGVKDDDWRTWRQAHTKATICRRDSKGNPYGCKDNDYQIKDFTAAKVDAEDGGVIDFSNKARLGTTLKGAGIGGALGGFAGYQGAQADIEERLNQALREYSASLEKIYCGTGKKFLGFYNDDVIIPTMKD